MMEGHLYVQQFSARRRAPIEQGEQVIAARTIETTQGLCIPPGSKGTVAEDRGSTLVVVFHHQTPPSNIDAQDFHRPGS
jgi:hypothetical protein